MISPVLPRRLLRTLFEYSGYSLGIMLEECTEYTEYTECTEYTEYPLYSLSYCVSPVGSPVYAVFALLSA